MDRAPERAPRRSRAEREHIVLDTAARLFYARGVHEVGMDELVRETGLGKATVYRLFATKDALVGAYLDRLSRDLLGRIDDQAARAGSPAQALHAVLDAIEADLSRPGSRAARSTTPASSTTTRSTRPGSPPGTTGPRCRPG